MSCGENDDIEPADVLVRTAGASLSGEFLYHWCQRVQVVDQE